MNKILLSFLLLLISSPAFAATYYIGCDGTANDSNNGTSTSTDWATSTPIQGSNFLKPDDVVNVQKGCVWTGTSAHWIIRSGGTSGHPIIIQTYGSGAMPIMNGTLPQASVSGWSGWTQYLGNVWVSNATFSWQVNTIVVDGTSTLRRLAYGGGAVNNQNLANLSSYQTAYGFAGIGNPIYVNLNPGTGATITITTSGGAISTGTVVAGGTGYSVNDIITVTQTGGATGTFTVSSVSGGVVTGITLATGGTGYTDASALPTVDNANPNSHTFEFGQIGSSTTSGFGGHDRGLFSIFDDTNTQYITINGIEVYGSNDLGFASGAPHIKFVNCLSEFNAREGFYLLNHVVSNTVGAQYDQLNNSSARWCNTNFGQQITIEAANVDVIGSLSPYATSEYGWMAGIDWLGYATDTPANYGRCIGCISHDNGQRAYNRDFNGFDPNGIYLDGANNIKLINTIVYASDPRFNGANGLYGIAIQTEHPSTHPDYNISLVNDLVYNINFGDVNIAHAINCSGAACNVNDNISIIGCTFVQAASGTFNYTGSSLIPLPSGVGIFLYNNIFYNNSGGTTGGAPITDSRLHSNNNLFYNTTALSWVYNTTIFAGTGYTLAQWQALTGQDTNSIFANPLFQANGGGQNNYYLQNIGAGQGSTSSAVGAGLNNYFNGSYFVTGIGTTRTDSVADTGSPSDIGYHYGQTYNVIDFQGPLMCYINGQSCTANFDCCFNFCYNQSCGIEGSKLFIGGNLTVN